MATHTAFPPPTPATQPDGDVRPASATEPSREPRPDTVHRPRDVSPTEIALEAYARYGRPRRGGLARRRAAPPARGRRRSAVSIPVPTDGIL